MPMEKNIKSLMIIICMIFIYGCNENNPNSTDVDNKSKLLFSGDFETGDLSQWFNNQSCPDAITIVTNPVHSGKYAAKFTVSDDDTKSNCPKSPTDDPRAQLLAYKFSEGDEFYFSMSTYFPSDFPFISEWFGIAQIYGPPYGGTPTIGIGINGDKLQYHVHYDNKHFTLWKSHPIAKGKSWETIILHIKLSTDRNVGFVELWHNGNKQKLDGKDKYFYPTLVENLNWTSKNGENYLYAQHYRSRNAKLGKITIFHDDFLIGKTLQDVMQ